MNNIAFDGDDIIVWQAFNVGIGIKMQRSKLLKNEQLDTGLKILSNFVGAQQIDGNITKKSKENTTGNTAEPIEQSVFTVQNLVAQCSFPLIKKTYQDGEVSGRKANPSDVSQHMKSLRKDNGEQLFSPNEWLQPSQISSYFARLSIMPRDQSNNADIIDEDLQSIVQAIEEEEIRNLVTASVSE
ncbi:unnamed protein product [Mytilus coruscus]|uniref:Uncharacterized protein n=1 Tax=Mytilus coruscus TaxID=42192 RepID=A0A6J8CUH7_MYTCO|nr:unnamed protein product [Mytilus coruscus]